MILQKTAARDAQGTLHIQNQQFKIQHTKQKPHSFAGNAAWGIEMKWCFYSAQVSTTLPD
jgi:hypothetical protein